MHCKSCEILMEKSLKEVAGVKSVDVNYKNGTARVSYEGQQPLADWSWVCLLAARNCIPKPR